MSEILYLRQAPNLPNTGSAHGHSVDVSISEYARYNDTHPGYLVLASPPQYTVQQVYNPDF